ncbi:MAG: hypothetical protein ACYDDF_05820 [Thermoplasmatota archaeon]
MPPIDAAAQHGRRVRLGLFGFGTVGRAFVRDLATRGTTAPIEVVSITDRRGTILAEPGSRLDLANCLSAKGAGTAHPRSRPVPLANVLDSAIPDIIVDALPTSLKDGEPSLPLTREALRRGISVATASKSAGALGWTDPSIYAAVGAAKAGRARVGRETNVPERSLEGPALYDSATVCAGTPILEILDGAFHGDTLLRFEGVLNGSTNYLLSRMEAGASFDDAFAEARGVGILEDDASLDLLGFDAGAKAVILGNHAWAKRWTIHKPAVRIQGIHGVSAAEAQEAGKRGMAIRLVARGDPVHGISVAPIALPREHPLVVPCTENAVRLKLQNAGNIIVRGPGAGGAETAAALTSDVLRWIRLSSGQHGRARQGPIAALAAAP